MTTTDVMYLLPAFIVILSFLIIICFLQYKLIKNEKEYNNLVDIINNERTTLAETKGKYLGATDELTALKLKHQQNPSYDCQQLLAEMLSGQALLRIERLDTENLFYRRDS